MVCGEQVSRLCTSHYYQVADPCFAQCGQLPPDTVRPRARARPQSAERSLECPQSRSAAAGRRGPTRAAHVRADVTSYDWVINYLFALRGQCPAQWRRRIGH